MGGVFLCLSFFSPTSSGKGKGRFPLNYVLALPSISPSPKYHNADPKQMSLAQKIKNEKENGLS